MIDALLPISLAFIMFSLGVSLQPADFLRVFSRPRAIAIGLFAQIICLPALAFLLLETLGVGGEMAVGVMILAACPGGVSAGLLTLLAGGETALSISLTALTSLIVIITLPLITGFATGHFAENEVTLNMSLIRTGGGVFLMTFLPVTLGMLVRHYRHEFAMRREKLLARIATVLFLLIVLLTFVTQREAIMQHLPTLGPLLILVNLLVMGLGFAAGGLSGLERPGRIAIAMECGLQNAALGIFVANNLLQAPALAAPSVVYAFLMNFSALALVAVRDRRFVRT